MSLSKEAKRRVRQALAGKLPVAELQTPLEYHYLAWHWNWDDGSEPLAWIIEQPDCDKGTALLIYWYGGAGWFRQYEDANAVQAAGGNVAGYQLVKKIETNVRDNFYTSEAINFNPQNDDGHDWTTEYADLPEKSAIPAIMLTPSAGAQLQRNILTEFVQRPLTTEEIESLNQKITHGFQLLQSTFSDLRDDASPIQIVQAVKAYVDVERQAANGGSIEFNAPQANVGWTLAWQIQRAYGWQWQIYSFDGGDSEHLGLMSPDNVYIVRPHVIVVLSISRAIWENIVMQLFELIGANAPTQAFRDFFMRGWMTIVPH